MLDFIYNSPQNKKFIFTGGTCLRLCYGLNRLSEGIDLVLPGDVDIKNFASDLENHFRKKLQYKKMEFAIKGKNQKIYLKFPILHNLGLVGQEDSDKLYIKVETMPALTKKYGLELTPVDREQLNFLVRHYDLPSLMAGKINAIFHRIYFKGKQNEITFKGRDIYDLIWYLDRGVHPNMEMIKEFLDIDSEFVLYQRILKKVESYKPEHLLKDLENLFDNQTFIKNWVANSKEILTKKLST